MKITKNTLATTVISACLLTLVSCVKKDEENAMIAMTARCETLMGLSQEETVLKLGSPTEIQNIGELTIYKYHTAYGIKSDLTQNYWSNTIYKQISYEVHDTCEIVFKSGKAISWKGNVKR